MSCSSKSKKEFLNLSISISMWDGERRLEKYSAISVYIFICIYHNNLFTLLYLLTTLFKRSMSCDVPRHLLLGVGRVLTY